MTLNCTYPLVEELDRSNLSNDILWKDLVEARGNLDFSVVRHIGDGVECIVVGLLKDGS